jgi:phosphoribosylanthranilate isomerase
MTTDLSFARTRIKICGLTRAQDVRACAQRGADALGFVFYPPSKQPLVQPVDPSLRL